jgi:penicillin-binding protein/penicillin-binding protein 1A
MQPIKSLRAITRRIIPLFYISPAECFIRAFSGSGSGAAATAVLDITPTEQKDGPAQLNAIAVGADVSLVWSFLPYAYSYVIYRATNPDGPFDLVAANVLLTDYVDVAPPTGTLYYKVTGIEPDFGETRPSPVVSVTV